MWVVVKQDTGTVPLNCARLYSETSWSPGEAEKGAKLWAFRQAGHPPKQHDMFYTDNELRNGMLGSAVPVNSTCWMVLWEEEPTHNEWGEVAP